MYGGKKRNLKPQKIFFKSNATPQRIDIYLLLYWKPLQSLSSILRQQLLFTHLRFISGNNVIVADSWLRPRYFHKILSQPSHRHLKYVALLSPKCFMCFHQDFLWSSLICDPVKKRCNGWISHPSLRQITWWMVWSGGMRIIAFSGPASVSCIEFSFAELLDIGLVMLPLKK